jgi:hypothetical protein
MEQWERHRGVRLFTEFWPLRKRRLADPQPPKRRSRYYTIQTGKPTPAVAEGPRDELPEPLSPIAVLGASYALGACALGVSGILEESALADAFRIVAGLGFVLLGVVVLQDWRAVRRRLAPRMRPALFKVLGGASLVVGAGAVVNGLARLFLSA